MSDWYSAPRATTLTTYYPDSRQRFVCTCGHIELDQPGTYDCAIHGPTIITKGTK